MVASSAFMTYADGPVAKETDPAGLTSAPGETVGAGNETAGSAGTEAVPPVSEAQNSSTSTVTAGSSASAGNTVTAGSSTVRPLLEVR